MVCRDLTFEFGTFDFGARMETGRDVINRFREVASTKFRFLEEMGFARSPTLEVTLPTVATLVYVGKYVAFVFSVDLRDKCVDGQVVLVRDGRLVPTHAGGYSSSIIRHLIEYEGYRGGPGDTGGEASSRDWLEAMVERYALLLQTVGQSLLADRSHSLPQGADKESGQREY